MFMQHKTISLLVSLVFLVGLGVSAYFLIQPTHKIQLPNTNWGNTNKSLPNALASGAASLERLTLKDHSFVVASSIQPVLRPGAAATALDIGVLPGVVDPHNGLLSFNSRVLENQYIVYLQQNGQAIELNGIDVATGKYIPSVTLAKLHSATSADGVYTSDNVMDFSVDQATLAITFTLRKNVIFDSPEPEGRPQVNSISELWTMTYPHGQLHKIATFPSVLITPLTKDTAAAYDLPLRAYHFQGKYLLEYQFRISTYDQSSKITTVLQDVGSHGFMRFSVAPTSDRAITIIFLNHSTISQTSFDSHAYLIDRTLSLKEFPVSQSDTILNIVWSPDSSTAMMKYNLKNVLILDVPTLQAKEIATPSSPSVVITNLYDLLSNDTALLGVQDANSPLDEIPTFDPNGLTEMTVWNFQTNTIIQVGNYRSPVYIGGVK